MSDLYTHVDGLAFPQTSADSLSPIMPHSNTHLPASSTGTFGTSHGSIFNNPNASSAANTARIHAFGAKRISYGNSSTSSAPTHSVTSSEGGVTKEVDDPSPHGSDRDRTEIDRNKKNKHITPTKMFLSPTSPGRPTGAGSYRGSDILKLDEFIYTRGFLEGACSDVTIIAFGTRYNLHRLILDRSPFFSSCFNGGPWRESSSSEIPITPEQSDPNITQHAFELALARLYGHADELKEENHALPLLAAASYLDLQDLAESCVASLLRNLKTSNIAKVLKFVTGSYYGHQTDRLLDSAKAMLYRDGWEMEMTEWDGISGELAAEIIGFDGFYVPDEWSRYCFVKEVINWRISQSLEAEKDKASDRESGFSMDDNISEDEFLAEDHEADVKPLRDLLENGIYYMHMSFEELQRIAADTDILRRPVVSVDVIREALWNQISFRQRVLNAPLHSPELGLTEKYVVHDADSEKKTKEARLTPPLQEPTSEKSTSPVLGSLPPSRSPVPSFLEEVFATGRKAQKRYIIPTEDSTIVIGDHMALPDQPLGSTYPLLNQLRGSRTLLHGQELTVAAMSGNGNNSLMMDLAQREELKYSNFPPFRFSAEFRGVRGLKEKKRVYSKTVFYAGSHWNIYIQKVRSSKNVQLGVYLHRAKDRESALNIAATGYAHGLPGMIQGDAMLLGHVDMDGTSSTASRSASSRPFASGIDFDNDGENTLIGHDSMMGNTHSNIGSIRNNSSLTGATTPEPQPQQSSQVPAVGYYTDARPQVQTYFKIFSPSKRGKVLSMFSSGPDSFNFSQSWGWKSSSLILDESLIAEGDKDARLRFMVVLGNV
ncbi:hypothetical protein L211DRAFT_490291 [Terfezia boudieri ATCC MYA-4762]|uniref:BTB domain-containing protein n=1 Tax=Terfezia boudieri ATCC MYA-4762 TaxID=1051890 RepID=A0A3N4LJV1_9PEZI|nr:hypothetical protein L211DRAFT_490291 [Terfezia boudieri ATCC MYA-4762]